MSYIINTARGANNINTDRIVVDMADKISLLLPTEYPLQVLTSKLNKRPTHNYRFDWLEDKLMNAWATCPAGATNVATTFAVAAGEGAIIAINDLLKNVTTGEVIRVTGVSGDTLTVARAYGETAGATIAANQKLLVIGNAMMQGSGAPAEKAANTVTNFNYTQIIKTAFSVTNTLEAMKLYGGGELARLHNRKGIEHARSIEYALLFGERKLDTTGAQPITTTGGVLQKLAGTTNVVEKAAASAVEADFDGFLEKLFTYGSKKKTMLCANDVLSYVNKFAKDRMQIILADKDKTYGLAINKYFTHMGELNLISHPLLENGYKGYGIALDIPDISYRPLTGRDTKLNTNIQNNDEDGRRDQFITEAGLELKHVEKHGIFRLTY